MWLEDKNHIMIDLHSVLWKDFLHWNTVSVSSHISITMRGRSIPLDVPQPNGLEHFRCHQRENKHIALLH